MDKKTTTTAKRKKKKLTSTTHPLLTRRKCKTEDTKPIAIVLYIDRKTSYEDK